MLYTAGNERIEDNTHAVSIVNDTLHIDRSKITTAPQTFILSAENNGREVKKEFSVVLSYDKFFVDLSVNDAAMGTVSGGGYINDGFECTITATANPGYKFVQWSDGNTENPRTITVAEDMAITAEFEASEYTVTVNSADESMGTVAVEPAKDSYLYGETVTVSADPNPGYKFVQWSDGNTENPRTITVAEDIAITAEFEASEYTVTVNSADESMGTVAVEPAKDSYLYGETVTVSADPNPGYKFVQWSDGNTENPRTITVTEDMAITAEFVRDIETKTDNTAKQTISVTAKHGTITVYGAEGETVTVYNTQGICVYSGIKDEPTVINTNISGVYIVTAKNESIKVLVK